VSRVEAARRRVTVTRYTLGIASVAALAAFAAAARASHPGAAQPVTRPSRATDTYSAPASSFDDSFFSDDSGTSSFGPAGSATPQIQSGGS
jgi:hypothetical protein